MHCLICDTPVGALSGKKLKNGKICKHCASKLPSLMLDGSPYLQEYTLKRAMSYVSGNMEKFCATASYGDLHIDSIHGLFAVASKLTSEGKSKSGNNVFSVYNLSEIGITCTSPHTDHGNVLVNVELTCRLEDPYISFRVPIKKGVRCHTERVDSSHVTWDEPNDLVMFKSMFNQMLSGAFEKVNRMLCGKTVREFEMEKARAIFMLPQDYTAEDLKKARRLMMKVYHPDVAGEDVTRESQIINDAHDLLKAELEIRCFDYSKENK